jgi:uncharacterized membrane protein YgaE (UPF0421/DUF939 family)
VSRWHLSSVPLLSTPFRPGRLRPALVTRHQVFLAAKAAVAAGLAWAAALAVHPHSRPYFAPIAVLLVVQPTVYDSLSRAFQRVVGVVVGVGAALVVSHFLSPSGWSVGIVIFAGLLLGWTARMGPQGAVQVPVSALLVFLVGRTTPGYGAARIVDTLIGAAVAVVAVLLSPAASASDAIIDDAVRPLRRASEILRAVSVGISAPWTADEASSWRAEALGLVDVLARARQAHEGHRVSARWNTRARRGRQALEGGEEALRTGNRIGIYCRSLTRALVDGSSNARPMPTLSTMLARTASAVDGYVEWVASADTPADRRQLSERVREADATLSVALERAQQHWGDDAGQWLTFGIVLAMSQRILAEVGNPIDSAEDEPIESDVPPRVG